MAVKFLIKTLGCKVNKYDSLALKRKLIGAGFVFDENKPDLVVVNTCAVTKNAIRKGRRMLNGLKTKHPQAKFVLMGCYPQTYPDIASGMSRASGAPEDQLMREKVDLIWGTGKQNELAREVAKILDAPKTIGTEMGSLIDPPKAGQRSRYFLKIQDGCEQFCSYCNIPFARGKLFSRLEEEIIIEVKEVIAAGFNEIVLCGIHLGLYGKEKNSSTCDLVQLLERLVKIENMGRLRLSSIEANDITQELLKIMSENEKICDHLHVPLQSGSDKILKLMNRPYDAKKFAEVLKLARKKMPKIAVTTDLIVGFPGETDKDFQRTLEFSKKCNFSKMHVFPFSAHEKTSASKMKGKVNLQIIKKRAELLRNVGKVMEQEYIKKFFGKKVSFVVEQILCEKISGKEEHYFDVIVEKGHGKHKVGSLFETILKT